MASADAGTAQVAARKAMLLQLGVALKALVRRLAVQRELAVGACTLAPRAEEIAQRARLLAFGRGRIQPEGLAELAADIGALAAEAASIVVQVQNGAALAGEVAAAIADHVATLAALSRDPTALADPANLRTALGRLSETLQRLSSGRQAQDSPAAALLALAGRSREFADRAARIAAQDVTDLREQALRLSRDLGDFAAQAVTVASTIQQDAEAGARTIARMNGDIGSMADQAAPAGTDSSIEERIAGLIRGRDESGPKMDWSRG